MGRDLGLTCILLVSMAAEARPCSIAGDISSPHSGQSNERQVQISPVGVVGW
jgi:hypothetical protein